jgi:hypothetical protein
VSSVAFLQNRHHCITWRAIEAVRLLGQRCVTGVCVVPATPGYAVTGIILGIIEKGKKNYGREKTTFGRNRLQFEAGLGIIIMQQAGELGEKMSRQM